MVGVSNDAVNFLNSAIGSKVAPRHVIMIVASIGIFMGATFSSGMMEIARKGIFNPQYFYFSEIMIIFLAVMLTDILLLDVFNTFGLPTSTTVSIVFELLGAATAVSIVKILNAGESIQELGTYLNASSAILIISGIFISIGVAFFIGSIIQFFSRILFSFHYKKRMKFVGGIWSAVALSCLTFFLLFKGLKGASFVSDNFVAWVSSHTLELLAGATVFWFLLSQILISFFHINILRFVVLFGTFSLAMAFAGNDLVNFIGVPIAGLESYQAWSGSGIEAENYTMDILSDPVKTKTYLLLSGGIIMVLTLWFSSKAQTVTETEVNLGRQDSRKERFNPNFLSRIIVRYTLAVGKVFKQVLPPNWLTRINNNFLEEYYESQADAPAFDLVRASVNLTVAGVLIAFATSLKLPLSTTYVSFMVAMGTSLADRAWGRDSAVYRIAGVLNVIGGWLMTAVIAFLVSGVFAFLMIQFGLPVILLLIAISVFIIVNTYRLHRKEMKRKSKREEQDKITFTLTQEKMEGRLGQSIIDIITQVDIIVRKSIKGLVREKRKKLQKAFDAYENLKFAHEDLRDQLYNSIKKTKNIDKNLTKNYVLAFDFEQDVLQSASLIVKYCGRHVENSHEPFNEDQATRILTLTDKISSYLKNTKVYLSDSSVIQNYNCEQASRDILDLINHYLQRHIERIQKGEFNAKNGELYLTLVLELKDLVEGASQLFSLFPRESKVTFQEPKLLLEEVD